MKVQDALEAPAGEHLAGTSIQGDALVANWLVTEALRRTANAKALPGALLAIVLLGSGVRRVAAPALRATRARPPSSVGTMIGFGLVRGTFGAVARTWPVNSPDAGMIIVASLLAVTARRVAASAVEVRGLRAVLRWLAPQPAN
jgi:hypothetical protein